MKFMVEFSVQSGGRERLIAEFERRGPNQHPGVVFRNAWVGTYTDVAFVLVEGESVAAIEKVAASWGEFGEHRIHAVAEVQDY